MTMLAIGVLAVVAIYWFFFRKKDESKKESNYNDDYLVIGDEMGPVIESSYGKGKGKGFKPNTENSTTRWIDCNDARSNKPCWDWVIGKGWKHFSAA